MTPVHGMCISLFYVSRSQSALALHAFACLHCLCWPRAGAPPKKKKSKKEKKKKAGGAPIVLVHQASDVASLAARLASSQSVLWYARGKYALFPFEVEPHEAAMDELFAARVARDRGQAAPAHRPAGEAKVAALYWVDLAEARAAAVQGDGAMVTCYVCDQAVAALPLSHMARNCFLFNLFEHTQRPTGPGAVVHISNSAVESVALPQHNIEPCAHAPQLDVV
jgi:hypothetical protein